MEEVGAVVAAGVEVVLEEGAVQAVEEVVLQEAVVGLEAEEGGFRLLLTIVEPLHSFLMPFTR